MGISGYGAWGNLITGNEIYNNAKGGFFTKMMCRDTTVSHNEVYGNGQGGIILRCKKSEATQSLRIRCTRTMVAESGWAVLITSSERTR